MFKKRPEAPYQQLLNEGMTPAQAFQKLGEPLVVRDPPLVKAPRGLRKIPFEKALEQEQDNCDQACQNLILGPNLPRP